MNDEVKLGIKEVKDGFCKVLGGFVFLGKILPPEQAYEILCSVHEKICKSE